MEPIVELFYNERAYENKLSNMPCLRTHIKLVSTTEMVLEKIIMSFKEGVHI